MSARAAVGAASATASIAALTWKRLFRGKAIWVSLLMSSTPALMAAVITNGRRPERIDDVLAICILLLGVVPTLHVASSLSEELEDRTSAYLWSRPIPRWTILSGKLVALVPFVAALSIAGALGAGYNVGAVGTTLAVGRVALGLGLGVVAVSACAVGIATIAPKHGAAIAMIYLLFVDHSIGVVPASLAKLSITHHVRELIEKNGAITATPLIGLAVITVVWLVVALSRIRRLE
jgi:ABC-2 type transport system permease protein